MSSRKVKIETAEKILKEIYTCNLIGDSDTIFKKLDRKEKQARRLLKEVKVSPVLVLRNILNKIYDSLA